MRHERDYETQVSADITRLEAPVEAAYQRGRSDYSIGVRNPKSVDRSMRFAYSAGYRDAQKEFGKAVFAGGIA